MVPPMILIILILLSHLLIRRSLKRKIVLIQLILNILRILLHLLLRKFISLYLLFPISLRRKTKIMLRGLESASLKSKSTFFYLKLVIYPSGIVEDVLIRVGEFIYHLDFVVIETEKVSNVASETPMILGRPFLATANALINCRNGMMRLSFGNMTLELNIFNM